jgi:N-acetylglucosaminyldiphosphoundecaprenol N-acetyl-beta-D-mannosaminyltransferase
MAELPAILSPAEGMARWRSYHLFDVRIDAASMDDAVAAARDAVQHRRRLLFGVVNAAKLVNMRRDPILRRAVLGSDVILADGMSVVWACRILRRPLPHRVTGIDLMIRLLEEGNQHSWRLYCLGATDEVLHALEKHIRATYPSIQIVGMRNGYFRDEEEEQLAGEISRARPDLLFVGMTSPKKERFLCDWSRTMQVPVCHGVGGAFDVVSGTVKRAPRLMQRLGLEWAYRIMQEPGRLWKRYLVTNTVFCWLLFLEIVAALRPSSRE